MPDGVGATRSTRRDLLVKGAVDTALQLMVAWSTKQVEETVSHKF